MGNDREDSHTAAGQMAGFMFQVPRALKWLAAGPADAAVGLETKDDVTVCLDDGREIREQDKSSIKEGGWPYGDKSYALWNTLAIWTMAIKAQQVDVDKTQFFLVTNKKMPEKCVVRLIVDACDEPKAVECCRQLREIGRSIKKESEAGRKARDVLSCAEGLLCKLVQHIEFESFQSEIGEKERKDIISLLHLSEREPHDMILDALLGWVFQTTLGLWHAGKPGWIRRKAFDNQLDVVRNKLRKERFRASPAREVLVSEEERELHIEKLFVKQLEIIAVEEGIAFEAITDFVRCGKERLKLGEEGMVTSQDWGDFHEKLKRKWTTISRIVQTEEEGVPEKLGQIVYHRTMDHEEPYVGEVETEAYLVRGSYHHLANELEVGWHPKYKDELKVFTRIGVENAEAY
jgi:hypothetical protein